MSEIKTILTVRDYKNKAVYQIEQTPYGYDLVFVEWGYMDKPWDYVDPILTNATLEECLYQLYDILNSNFLDKGDGKYVLS